MPTLLELAKLAGAAYDTPPSAVAGWSCARNRVSAAGGLWEGLQAGYYTGAGGGVIAFRGTNLSTAAVYASLQDLYADAVLGTGENSSYFSSAEEFCRPYKGDRAVVVCGHSLGGAIAQIVANRMGFRMATFNAPGVATFASRNVMSSNAGMLALRAAGTAVSAITAPGQALRDVRATFRHVNGVNIRIEGDKVSQIGIHYGKIQDVPSAVKGGALTQHGIGTVIASLEADPIGKREISSF